MWSSIACWWTSTDSAGWWISRPACIEGGAQRDFIDSEAERYRPQLLRYAALAAELGPEPVRLALYFPLLGVFRELDAPAA